MEQDLVRGHAGRDAVCRLPVQVCAQAAVHPLTQPSALPTGHFLVPWLFFLVSAQMSKGQGDRPGLASATQDPGSLCHVC